MTYTARKRTWPGWSVAFCYRRLWVPRLLRQRKCGFQVSVGRLEQYNLSAKHLHFQLAVPGPLKRTNLNFVGKHDGSIASEGIGPQAWYKEKYSSRRRLDSPNIVKKLGKPGITVPKQACGPFSSSKYCWILLLLPQTGKEKTSWVSWFEPFLCRGIIGERTAAKPVAKIKMSKGICSSEHQSIPYVTSRTSQMWMLTFLCQNTGI